MMLSFVKPSHDCKKKCRSTKHSGVKDVSDCNRMFSVMISVSHTSLRKPSVKWNDLDSSLTRLSLAILGEAFSGLLFKLWFFI